MTRTSRTIRASSCIRLCAVNVEGGTPTTPRESASRLCPIDGGLIGHEINFRVPTRGKRATRHNVSGRAGCNGVRNAPNGVRPKLQRSGGCPVPRGPVVGWRQRTHRYALVVVSELLVGDRPAPHSSPASTCIAIRTGPTPRRWQPSAVGALIECAARPFEVDLSRGLCSTGRRHPRGDRPTLSPRCGRSRWHGRLRRATRLAVRSTQRRGLSIRARRREFGDQAARDYADRLKPSVVMALRHARSITRRSRSCPVSRRATNCGRLLPDFLGYAE